MALFVAINIVGIYYILADLIPNFQKKEWKMFWAYVVMFAAVYILSFLLALDIKIPSPSEGLKKLINAIIGQ